MRLKDFGKKGLKNPTFILTGGLDPFVIKLAREHLANLLGIQCKRLSLKNTDLAEVYNLVRGGNLFSTRNLYIIEDVESLKKSNLKEFVQYFRDLPEHNIVIVLIKNKYKVPKEVLATGQVVKLKLDVEDDLIPWIKSRFHEAGIEVDRKVLDYLIDCYQDNLEILERELDKINYYFQEKKNISVDELVTILTDTPVVNANRFAKAIMRQNKQDALDQIRHMKEWDMNLQLVIGTVTGYLLKRLGRKHVDYQIIRDLNYLFKIDLASKSKTQLPWHYLELFTITN